VGGADLMDGTPIFDIKPYIPYGDCHPNATGGFTDTAGEFLLKVDFPSHLLAVLPEDVCVVHAHPFRDDMVVETPAEGLFGMEVFNGGTEQFRNEIARQYARHFHLAMTSGSDIHDMTRFAKGGIETPHRIQTPEDLVRVLRSGEYSLIETY
jgi:hypothetical protein